MPTSIRKIAWLVTPKSIKTTFPWKYTIQSIEDSPIQCISFAIDKTIIHQTSVRSTIDKKYNIIFPFLNYIAEAFSQISLRETRIKRAGTVKNKIFFIMLRNLEEATEPK
ncbi:MAG: hypothetical protein CMH70_04710 [Nitrosomonadaceae bacterium]|nr:hypothetical protein [Nitrosomonadaceae bacterium]|tara:strand:+ start:973 stop:1302 length:330 start_codon:yes stop_codon:yes gene_type:complete